MASCCISIVRANDSKKISSNTCLNAKKVSPIMKTIKSFQGSVSLVVQIFHLAKVFFREHAYKFTIDVCLENVFLIG